MDRIVLVTPIVGTLYMSHPQDTLFHVLWYLSIYSDSGSYIIYSEAAGLTSLSGEIFYNSLKLFYLNQDHSTTLYYK